MAVLVASTLSLGRREFAKTLSPGGRLEPAHLELKMLELHFLQKSQAPDRRLDPVEAG